MSNEVEVPLTTRELEVRLRLAEVNIEELMERVEVLSSVILNGDEFA